MAVVDLVVGAHEVHRGMVSEYSRIAVVPLAVELDEIPVVAVAVDRESFDHHVGDAGAVEKHLGASEIHVAVAASSRKASVRSFLVSHVIAHRLVRDVRMHPLEDGTCGLDITVAPQ